MQYLLLIYGSESRWDKLSGAEREKTLQEYGAFTQSIHKSGHLRGVTSWTSRPRPQPCGCATASAW